MNLCASILISLDNSGTLENIRMQVRELVDRRLNPAL